MLRTGQRKVVCFLAGLVAAFVLMLVTVLRCPEHITAVGTAIAADFGVLGGILVGGNIAEWTQRRKDPSSIADQVREEREGKTP